MKLRKLYLAGGAFVLLFVLYLSYSWEALRQASEQVTIRAPGERQLRTPEPALLYAREHVDFACEQVQVGVYGFVACLGASSLIYRVEQTSKGWRVAGIATQGPVA